MTATRLVVEPVQSHHDVASHGAADRGKRAMGSKLLLASHPPTTMPTNAASVGRRVRLGSSEPVFREAMMAVDRARPWTAVVQRPRSQVRCRALAAAVDALSIR